MKLQPIKPKVIIETKKTTQEKVEMPVPKHYCNSCTRLGDDLICDCFNRRVEPDYNRCFNHSNYTPSFKALKYVSPPMEVFKEWEEEASTTPLKKDTKAA